MEILKQNIDSLLIKCGFCKGTGIWPIYSDESEVPIAICPSCKGKGVLIEQVALEDILDCSYCKGDGKAWNEGGYYCGETCPVCKGRGYNYVNELRENRNGLWEIIHTKVKTIARARFLSRNYSDAVEAALKELNDVLKNLVKDQIGIEIDGSKLMERCFSLQNPILKVGDLDTQSGKDIQKGYLQIFSGAMIGIRNPRAHGNIDMDENTAIHMLYLVSHLFYVIDRSTQ